MFWKTVLAAALIVFASPAFAVKDTLNLQNNYTAFTALAKAYPGVVLVQACAAVPIPCPGNPAPGQVCTGPLWFAFNILGTLNNVDVNMVVNGTGAAPNVAGDLGVTPINVDCSTNQPMTLQ